MGNTTNKSSDTIRHASTTRPVNNSTHTSAGLPQGNTNENKSSNTTTVKPVTPAKPAETKPVTPSKPVTPAKPVNTKSAEPTTPTKPVEPSKPATSTKPVEPTTPSKPVTPTAPTTPAKSVEPSKPVQPAQPTKPVEPTKPATPNKPAQPAKPVTPTQPAKPVQPTTPTDNNQDQRLTNSQYEQIFWDNYMAPAGWQKGNIPITDYQVKNGVPDYDTLDKAGKCDGAYMQLYNGNYVNTPQSKAEFVQDASKLGNEYSWNDTSEYHKATIRATQPDNNSVRIDVLRYN